jgi:NADPH:quinone reductase-like Zn-dependent oxidoreductase
MGERLLVSGAAGGVGLAAVQLATMAGARVSATVRDDELRARVEALGVRAMAPDEFGGEGPYDVVLELVGAPNMAANLAALADCGRIAVIGVSAGSTFELDLSVLMAKRGRIHASSLRSRSLEEKAHAARLVERAVLPGFASGDLIVPVEASFGLDEVGAAYERFAAGGKFGKIVLTL